MDIIQEIEKSFTNRKIVEFTPGDTIRIDVKIREDEKFRIQAFEGVVISLRKRGLRSSFTVRKVSFGHGVERIFPLFSPSIQSIKRIKKGRVRRAKLYYLRERKGKSARIKEIR